VKSRRKKNSSGAAIVCCHVASGKFPITVAERSESDDPVDTGWQFVCSEMPHQDVQDAKVWALNEVLELDPSLEGLLDQPAGTRLVRKDKSAPWQIMHI
jgi:hypothetical protein